MSINLNIRKAIVICMLLSLSESCSYNSEEELYPSVGCDSKDMSYSGDIVALIVANCYVCHDAKTNNGNVILEGYQNLKKYVDNGKLIGVITHSSGFPPMPNGQAKLLDCQIEKIQSWIDTGAQNN
jgi:hypothetical protein